MLGRGPDAYKVVGKCGMAWEQEGTADRVNAKQRGSGLEPLSLESHSVDGALDDNADSWAWLQTLAQGLREWDRTATCLTASLSTS